MNPEYVPIVGPAVSLFGAVATPFIVKFVNGAMTKSDRWEDYRCCEEFVEKLTPETHPLVIEKWYEAISNGDRAEAAEILYMLDLRFSSEEISLRRRAKDLIGFAKLGVGDAGGYRFKELMRFSWVRGAYSFGNLIGYFVGFGLPMIPAIRNEWSFLARDWHAVVVYCLLCAMGFGFGASRIRAMLNMKAARRLVAKSQGIPSREAELINVPSNGKPEPAPALEDESKPNLVPAQPLTEVAPTHLDAAE